MGDTQRTATVETALGAGVLILRRMSGREQLGRLFSFELELLSERDDIQLSDVLGTFMTVCLEVAGDRKRYFHGLVTAFGCVGSKEPGTRHVAYRARLNPSLWLLTRSADCRIFQHKSVPEIAKEVLEEHGVQEVEDALLGSFRSWDYLVQYRETAFNFVSRLLEQEGIYYYFRHENGRHVMVLANGSSAHEPAEGYAEVAYQPPSDQGRRRECMHGWRVEQRIQPGTYVLNDFDFTRPSADLEAQLSASKQHAFADLEQYDYPGEYQETADGESYARARLEELHAEFQVVRAEGNVRGLGAGMLFSLCEHSAREQNVEHLVVSSEFQLEAGSQQSGEQSQAVFQQTLVLITSSTPYRAPRTTPKPLIAGLQTATVVGKAGEEIWTDEYGRVKVLFHWDRAGKQQGDENTSCWIRVAQLWAGSGWGGLHVPRVGQEVVVEFLEGDPDRPLITGRVYNASQMPPYELPGQQTQSGIKSRSSKGGGQDNCNEIRFEDKKGSEQLFVQAEKDHEVVVKNDETLSVGANRTRSVAKDESVSVDGQRTKSVGKSESISIGDDESISIGKTLTLDVGDAATVSIGKDYTISVSQGRSLQISKDDQVDVGGQRSQTIAKDEVLDVGKKLTINAGDQITLKTGSASIVLKKNGNITLEGKDITIKASGKVKVKASSDVSLKGSKVTQN